MLNEWSMEHYTEVLPAVYKTWSSLTVLLRIVTIFHYISLSPASFVCLVYEGHLLFVFELVSINVCMCHWTVKACVEYFHVSFFPRTLQASCATSQAFGAGGNGKGNVVISTREVWHIFWGSACLCECGFVCVAVWHWVSSEGNLLKISLLFSRTVVTLSTLNYHKRKRCTNVTKPVIRVDFFLS